MALLHFILQRLKITPARLAAMPREQRAFVRASMRAQIEAEQQQVESLKGR